MNPTDTHTHSWHASTAATGYGSSLTQQEWRIPAPSGTPVGRSWLAALTVAESQAGIGNEQLKVQALANAPWWPKFERTVERLRSLGAGWNGANERAIHTSAINRLVATLEELAEAIPTLACPHISPVSNGGVQVEWQRGEAAVEVSIGPEGAAAVWVGNQVDPDREFELNGLTGLPALAAALTKLG